VKNAGEKNICYITSITTYYFHICCYITTSLLPLMLFTSISLPPIISITTHYFHVYCYLSVVMDRLLRHYCLITTYSVTLLPLLPITSMYTATFSVVMDRLLLHDCLITTYSVTLLPLLPITSTSLLLITTKHVFIIAHY
jgi:hypothetical protein